MTHIEAMKQGLEALEVEDMACRYEKEATPEYIAKAITSLRQAIAEAEKQEPVIDKSAAIRIATALGWTPPAQPKPIQNLQCFHCQDTIETLNDKVMQLMVKREWVGLTPTDMEELSATWWKPNENEMALIDWVEAKLKQKNGYAEEKNT